VCVSDGWSRAFALLTPVSSKTNILIDQTGRARLADFGLVTIISDCSNLLSSSSHTQGGTARWMSPELIDPKRFGFRKSCRTESSDCYALGMVVYETISGRFPFYKHADLTVVMRVLEGEHPTRGAGFAESLWDMLKLCWTPQPNNRPSIDDVLQCLEGVRTLSEPPSPGADEETESDGDNLDTGEDSLRMFSHSISSMTFCGLTAFHN
jgi:serine/threonine protein kinase